MGVGRRCMRFSGRMSCPQLSLSAGSASGAKVSFQTGGTERGAVTAAHGMTVRYYNSMQTVSISDDDVAFYDPGGAVNGGLWIMSGSLPSYPSGVFYVRAGSSPNITLISAINDGDLEYTTGVLTQGSGTNTDGKVTLSADTDGKIYIKNRMGGTRTFSGTLFAK